MPTPAEFGGFRVGQKVLITQHPLLNETHRRNRKGFVAGLCHVKTDYYYRGLANMIVVKLFEPCYTSNQPRALVKFLLCDPTNLAATD